MRQKLQELKNSLPYQWLILVFALLGMAAAASLLVTKSPSSAHQTAYIIFWLCLVGVILTGLGWVDLYLAHRVNVSQNNNVSGLLEKNEVDFLIGYLRRYHYRRIRVMCLVTIFYFLLGALIWASLSADSANSLALKLLLLAPVLLFELTFIWSLLWWPWKLKRRLQQSGNLRPLRLKIVGPINFHNNNHRNIWKRFKLQSAVFTVGPKTFQCYFNSPVEPNFSEDPINSITVEYCALLPHVPLRLLSASGIVYDQTLFNLNSAVVIGDNERQLVI